MKIFKIDLFVALIVLIFGALIGIQQKYAIVGSYGFLAVGIALICYAFYTFYYKNVITANANEWLLIIKDGNMIQGGIGLRRFVDPRLTYVKFNSSLHKVDFDADQVTKEMQGVKLSGSASFQVYREGNGPFKYYKYMQNPDADYNVKILCEAIVRHQIAQHNLSEVLQKREKIRDALKKEIQQILTGWGVWLESIEIREVIVCSKTLFEDMQTEDKLKVHVEAEIIRLRSGAEITQEKYQSELNQTKQQANNQTQKLKFSNQQELQRAEQENDFQKKIIEMDIQQIQKEKELALEQLKKQGEIRLQEEQNKAEMLILEKTAEIERKKKELEQIMQWKPNNFKKYEIDATVEIYKNLPIKDLKLSSYNGPENNNIPSLIPGLSMLMQSSK